MALRPATSAPPLVAVMGIFALLAPGCARVANTSAQDVAWNRWNTCHQEVTGTDLNSIQGDGRISFWYNGPGEGQPMLDCLRQAGKAGPTLPEPTSELRPGGSGGGGGAM